MMTTGNLLVDCSTLPRTFSEFGWRIWEHFSYEDFLWNPQKIKLLTLPNQEDGMMGSDIRRKLFTKRIASACVLDFLIETPQLIPEEWKLFPGIMFWGTTYKKESCLFVRCLEWNRARNGKWSWMDCSLNHIGFGNCPAALLAA